MKVRYIGTTDGQVSWAAHDDPRKYLVVGGEYEVESKEVHTWHTKLRLVEFPGKQFNSVSFEVVDE